MVLTVVTLIMSDHEGEGAVLGKGHVESREEMLCLVTAEARLELCTSLVLVTLRQMHCRD